MNKILDKLGQTTLILGAGASHVYGFPLGEALKNKLLDADGHRDALLRDLGHSDTSDFRSTLRFFEAKSIDEYLVKYPKHAPIAKLKIAYHLIQTENLESLFNQGRTDHWYKYLWTEVLKFSRNLGQGQLSILTFNYDLSLEAYLLSAFRARHDTSVERAREYLNLMPVLHLHGQVGPVDLIHGKGRPYGKLTADALSAAADRIFAVHEADSSKNWQRAHQLLEESETVLFLGFGFGKENIRRLQLSISCAGETQIVIASVDCRAAARQLARYAPGLNIAGHRNVETAKSPASTEELARWLFEGVGGGHPLSA